MGTQSLTRIGSTDEAERRAFGAEPTDGDLVEATRAGDDRAFEQLFARYQRRVAAYVHGMVADHGRAEDITQEVFISALRRMRATDRPIAFRPWIHEIAKNACIDQFRRSRRGEEISYDAAESLRAADYGRLVARGLGPEAVIAQKQALHDLKGAFGGLSDTHHRILVLRELEGLSYREIGERLGMSRASVESTLFRARRRLAEEYDDLASGERCLRVQAQLADAPLRALGSRDSRRLSNHVAHCQACRLHARSAGLDAAALARRPTRREAFGAKIAGLLPLPILLRFRRGEEAVARLSTAGPAAEPVMAGWAKAATAAAVVVAGVGAGAGVGDKAVSELLRPGGDRPAAATQRAVDAPEPPAGRVALAAGREPSSASGSATASLGVPRVPGLDAGLWLSGPAGVVELFTDPSRRGAAQAPGALVGPAPGLPPAQPAPGLRRPRRGLRRPRRTGPRRTRYWAARRCFPTSARRQSRCRESLRSSRRRPRPRTPALPTPAVPEPGTRGPKLPKPKPKPKSKPKPSVPEVPSRPVPGTPAPRAQGTYRCRRHRQSRSPPRARLRRPEVPRVEPPAPVAPAAGSTPEVPVPVPPLPAPTPALPGIDG
jgi:RNA polymerase sigma factor (sigma-70 family)